MKKMLLIFTTVFAAGLSHAQINLNWTESSDSVQAVLYNALYDYEQADKASPYPTGFVKRRNADELFVQFENDTLVCDSKSFGMTTVQSYECLFPKSKFPWAISSDSIQAVIYEALYKSKQADDVSPYPQRFVKSGTGAQLFVEDEHHKLVCDSKSFGLTPALSYQCELLTK